MYESINRPVIVSLIPSSQLLFQYKYQVNIDGTVAAYRLPYLLAGDSLVLKQDSSYYEFFYNELKPYEHYVPFQRDLGDLLEKLQWAKDHDAEVRCLLCHTVLDFPVLFSSA